MDEPKVISGDLVVDDRGKLIFINDFDMSKVKRFYIVSNHAETLGIRGWHGHKKEAKYAFMLRGYAIFLLRNMETNETTKFALSWEKPEVLYIPAGYTHAFQTKSKKNQIIFYSTATLEESKDDDFREPFTQEDAKLLKVAIR